MKTFGRWGRESSFSYTSKKQREREREREKERERGRETSRTMWTCDSHKPPPFPSLANRIPIQIHVKMLSLWGVYESGDHLSKHIGSQEVVKAGHWDKHQVPREANTPLSRTMCLESQY